MLHRSKRLLIFAVVFAYFGVGSALAQKSPQFGLEIKSEGAKDALRIHIPVEGKKRLYAYIPVKNSGEVSTLRVMPAFKNGKLEVEFYEITGDFAVAKTCAQKLLLPTRLVAKEDFQMQLGGETFNVQGDSGWVLQLTIIDGSNLVPPSDKSSKSLQESEGGCGCGTCSGLSCCPSSGNCLGCGDCGQVCCDVIIVRPS